MKTTLPGVRQHGFTLIELLAVIVIVAILVSLMMPALSRAKGKASAIACVSNHRQICIAYQTYSADAADRLVTNFDDHDSVPIYTNWSAGTLDSKALEKVVERMRNPQLSILTPHLGDIRILKCPSDKSTNPRSVSVNCHLSPAASDGKPWWCGWNVVENRQIAFRFSEIQTPANLFCELDESQQTINDGYFAVSLEDSGFDPLPTSPGIKPRLGDSPGKNHNGGGTVAFADGHVESHQWESFSVGISGIVDRGQAGLNNLRWLQMHSQIRSN